MAVVYDINEIRRENLRALARAHGGTTRLAEKLQRSQSQISQLIGKRPLKNIGDRMARGIEHAFEKPNGWLDILHQDVRETITAYELLKSTAPHRPVPLISWHDWQPHLSFNACHQLPAQAQVPGHPKLSERAFALRSYDLERDHLHWRDLPLQAILMLDPDKTLYDDARIGLLNPATQRLSIQQIRLDGDNLYLKHDVQVEAFPSDSQYIVIRQILIEFE